jgi:hypothetical protein
MERGGRVYFNEQPQKLPERTKKIKKNLRTDRLPAELLTCDIQNTKWQCKPQDRQVWYREKKAVF